MEIVLICTVFGVFLCISFLLGAKVGQRIVQNKPIEMPTLNPIKKVQEAKQTQKENKELERLETILNNIDNYDGTSAGQKVVKSK